jgi:hypothetical protein
MDIGQSEPSCHEHLRNAPNFPGAKWLGNLLFFLCKAGYQPSIEEIKVRTKIPSLRAILPRSASE